MKSNFQLRYTIFSFVVATLLCFGCRSSKETAALLTDKPPLVTFLDSTLASVAIIADEVDGIFDQMSKLEMEIQMKQAPPFSNRKEGLVAYQNFLRTEVSNWTLDEKIFIHEVFTQAKAICDAVSPRLFPGDLRLVKIKTNHYGPTVYYTRGKDIMIPENILKDENVEEQLPVMLHEIFHVLSRNNPVLKHDLYNLIGFVKADKPVKLISPLSDRLLSNPDGVSMQYIMEVEKDNTVIKIVPLITSKFKSFTKATPSFFDYLNFDLYVLQDKGDYYEVQSDAAANTTMGLKSTPTFFTKIKDNTQYIIHPDEIMADNFMLALLAVRNNDFSKFSKDGKELVESVLARLKQL